MVGRTWVMKSAELGSDLGSPLLNCAANDRISETKYLHLYNATVTRIKGNRKVLSTVVSPQ